MWQVWNGGGGSFEIAKKEIAMTKKQTAGQRMIASAKQALAFVQGEENGCVVHIPDEIDTVRIRKKINMSQSQFAAYFGVSVRTIQEWEQGRVVPSRSARAFLTVIDREPEAVRRALVSFSTEDAPTVVPQ
jgi:putative transcriptional regulator